MPKTLAYCTGTLILTMSLLPLKGCLIESVRLNNVRITGGLGFKIFDAADVQFTGDTDVGPLIACNALAITRLPQSQMAATGGQATFTVGVAGAQQRQRDGADLPMEFQRRALDRRAGQRRNRRVGRTTTLHLENIQPCEAGRFSVTVSYALDAFDVATHKLAPDRAPVSATSAAATLTVARLNVGRGRGSVPSRRRACAAVRDR